MNKKLLALTLGDGFLSNKGTLIITHTLAQREYAEWKASLFNKEVSIEDNKCYFKKGTFNYKDNGQEIRKKLYGVLGHKYLTKDIVNEMDLFCFAILYLDKGSLCAKRKNGKIHAYDLVISLYGRKDECQHLIDKLKAKWGLSFTLKHNKGKYSIRCGTKEARKFLALIRPIVPTFECFANNKMQYI